MNYSELGNVIFYYISHKYLISSLSTAHTHMLAAILFKLYATKLLFIRTVCCVVYHIELRKANQVMLIAAHWDN